MNCKRVGELFAGHVDGVLGESEREALRAHLDSCWRCAAEVEAQRHASVLARSAPRFAAPKGFSMRVMSEIRELDSAPGLFGWLWALPPRLKLLEAAAIAIVVFMGVHSAGFLSDRIAGGQSMAGAGEASLVASVSVEYLDPVPPESMADMYLSAGENGNEN